MKVGTQLMAVRVKKTVQSWHEVGQLKQDMHDHSTSWEDRISSSGNASAMLLGMQAAICAPEIRTQLVEDLRAQIEAGTYEIDSMMLARKMLNSSKSF